MTGRPDHSAAWLRSKCSDAMFLVANADRVRDLKEKDFAVTDFPRRCRRDDGGDGRIHAFVWKDQFNFDLGKHVNGILASTIGFRMSLLASVTAHIGDGHAGNAKFE